MTQFYSSCMLSILILLMSLAGPLQAQQVIFTDDFENGNFRPEWQLKTGQPNGVIEVTAENSLSGDYSARMGKSSDDQYTLNRLDLKLNLSQSRQFFLNIVIYNNYDETHVQDGIFLSTDGGSSFQKIYDFKFEDWIAKHSGSLPPINISALARKKGMVLSSETVIRFQQYGKDDFTGSADFSDGFYLDDVVLTAIDFPYASIPFTEDFSSGSIKAPLMMGDPSLSDSSGVLSNASLLEVGPFSQDSLQGQVVKMGSRFDNSPATNALDLYLNLKGETNVKLTFDFYDNRDETSPADGLFFSDNGGFTFTKVMSFDTDNWTDDYFGSLPLLDVDQIALQHDLSLSSNFVIRMQQHGSEDFEGSRLSSDGIMIDNIQVFSSTPEYAQVPFTETFDSLALAPYWEVEAPHHTDMPYSISPSALVELVDMEGGNRAIRLGTTTDRCYTTNALDLYIQLADHPHAALSFRYMDHFDETHEQDGVFFSDDNGKSFKKVFSFDGDQWTDKEFGAFTSLSISQLARAQGIRLTDTFVIRFQQHDNDDFIGTRTISDGIYLDDITITEPQPTYASVPFHEDFEKDTLGTHWRFGNPMLTARVQNIKPGGVVTLRYGVGAKKTKGLAIGRESDGKLTTKSYDLHLALNNEKDLQIRFWMHNNYNELDEEDGIWLSKDGGDSFKKAWTYPDKPGSSSYYALNLDSLLLVAGQRYTDEFVVRFQQSDDRRFEGRGNMRGGIYLDDIIVTHVLDTPVIAWPTDSAFLTDCRENVIFWEDVAHSRAYRTQLFVMHGEEQETVLIDTTLDINQIKFPQLEQDSLYYCRIQAKSDYYVGAWSKPVMFKAHQLFEVDLQISAPVKGDSTITLQASKLPSYEYYWYKNGEQLVSTLEPVLKVKEPGNYSVFVTNQNCGIMSSVLEVEKETLYQKENTSENEPSASSDYGGQ